MLPAILEFKNNKGCTVYRGVDTYEDENPLDAYWEGI